MNDYVHPIIWANVSFSKQFREMLDVLERHNEISVIFTKANADTGRRVINEMIDGYVDLNEDRCQGYTSLRKEIFEYITVLQYSGRKLVK